MSSTSPNTKWCDFHEASWRILGCGISHRERVKFFIKKSPKMGNTLFKTNKIARCCCIHGSRVGRKKCRGSFILSFHIFFNSQIWLNRLMDVLHLGYIRNFLLKKKEKKKPKIPNSWFLNNGCEEKQAGKLKWLKAKIWFQIHVIFFLSFVAKFCNLAKKNSENKNQ